MFRIAFSIGVALVWLSLARPAGANTLRFDVPPGGGAYTIDVHPDILTVLHFSAEVQVAYCLDGSGRVEVTQHQYSVAVRPRPRTRHANVNVTTPSNHVGILLRVVDRPEDAALQVHFRDQEVDAEIERRVRAAVARRRAALEAELAGEQRRLDELVHRKAGQQVADGLRRRFRVRRVVHTARRDDVILRVRRIAWIGRDVHVLVSLENRREAPFVIGAVALTVDGAAREAVVSLPARGHAGVRGVVRSGTTARGVVTIPGARAGSVAAIAFTEPGSDRPLGISLVLRE